MSEDPDHQADRLCAHLTGTRWSTPTRGLLEIVAAEAVRSGRAGLAGRPLTVQVLVANDDWPRLRRFAVTFTAADDYPAAGPAGNAEALAEDALILLERYLETGAAARVLELPVH